MFGCNENPNILVNQKNEKASLRGLSKLLQWLKWVALITSAPHALA